MVDGEDERKGVVIHHGDSRPFGGRPTHRQQAVWDQRRVRITRLGKENVRGKQMTQKDKVIQELTAENKQLKARIEAYVREFKVCRFCAYLDADCSPTGKTGCHPKWRGL